MPQEHHGLERLELAKGQNVAQQHTASTFIFCPERSTADLWYWEVLHQKVNTHCSMLLILISPPFVYCETEVVNLMILR